MLGDVGIASDGAEVPNEVRVPRARTPLRIVDGAAAGGEDECLGYEWQRENQCVRPQEAGVISTQFLSRNEGESMQESERTAPSGPAEFTGAL